MGSNIIYFEVLTAAFIPAAALAAAILLPAGAMLTTFALLTQLLSYVIASATQLCFQLPAKT